MKKDYYIYIANQLNKQKKNDCEIEWQPNMGNAIGKFVCWKEKEEKKREQSFLNTRTGGGEGPPGISPCV